MWVPSTTSSSGRLASGMVGFVGPSDTFKIFEGIEGPQTFDKIRSLLAKQ